MDRDRDYPSRVGNSGETSSFRQLSAIQAGHVDSTGTSENARNMMEILHAKLQAAKQKRQVNPEALAVGEFALSASGEESVEQTASEQLDVYLAPYEQNTTSMNTWYELVQSTRQTLQSTTSCSTIVKERLTQMQSQTENHVRNGLVQLSLDTNIDAYTTQELSNTKVVSGLYCSTCGTLCAASDTPVHPLYFHTYQNIAYMLSSTRHEFSPFTGRTMKKYITDDTQIQEQEWHMCKGCDAPIFYTVLNATTKDMQNMLFIYLHALVPSATISKIRKLKARVPVILQRLQDGIEEL